MNRRNFLQYISTGTLLSATGAFPFEALAMSPAEVIKLTILHTNDVHSRIEPFPMDGSRNAGMGGAAKRASLIAQVRQKEKNVLVLDAGDMFQGTPYFNFFGGEVEFKLMSEMGYDVATLGNHDFDNGLDGLKKQLHNAKFEIVNCNYDFKDTVLQDTFKPYKIIEKDGLKIGIIGVGIKLDGMVAPKMFANTVYENPIEKVNFYANKLKNDLKCDYIICLSHLGYKYNPAEKRVSDIDLAKQTKHINLILGGHTHTFLNTAERYNNADGKEVIINQVGWGGMVLGRLDVLFERNRKKDQCTICENTGIK